jgi:hypothetical protein
MRNPLFSGSNDNDRPDALRLLSMPARARAIALRCGSEEVAELLELHARLCERNLEASSGKKRSTGVKPTEVV